MNLMFLKPEYFEMFNELDIFRKRGKSATITDFYLVTGGYVDSYPDYLENTQDFSKRICNYWLQSHYDEEIAKKNKNNVDCYVNNIFGTHLGNCSINVSNEGLRLVLSCADFSVLPNYTRAADGILELEYGQYPQTVPSPGLQRKLERAFENNNLEKTGNSYSLLAADSIEQINVYLEYSYNNKRYIRMKQNFAFYYNRLNNGKEYTKSRTCIWVEVEPVKWLVDEKQQIMVTEKILLSGVPFDIKREKPVFFTETFIKKYMDSYLARDLIQDKHLLASQMPDNIYGIFNKWQKLQKDIKEMSLEKKKAFLVPDTNISKEELLAIRDFITKLDGELVSTYDTLLSEKQEQEEQAKQKKKEKDFWNILSRNA